MRNQTRPTTTIARLRFTSVLGALALGGTLAMTAATQAPRTDVVQEYILTPTTIADAIEDEFLLDHAVPAHDIVVTMDNGIATLKGTVTNLLASERAERLAESVKGVRQVDNRILVLSPWLRTDKKMAADINAAWIENPAADAYEITATVDTSQAILTGTVDSWRERELAETIAKGVRGITSIDNKIIVQRNADRADYELQAEIEESLRWDVLVDDALIEVTVDDGVATLAGVVGSAAERRQARLNALVPGVTQVVSNDLQVEHWTRHPALRGEKYVDLSDAALRAAIDRKLARNPYVNSALVSVGADEFDVTLRGYVETLMAKRTAEHVARTTLGVESVANRLKVKPGLERPLKDVLNNFERAVARDPWIERFEITADMDGNTMHLRGYVDRPFEKRRAENLAAQVKGVKHIENHITVDPMLRDSRHLTYNPYVDIFGPDLYGWVQAEVPFTWKSDADIKDDVIDQMWWSPFVDADDVRVSVNNGLVHLTGAVDSWSEHAAALENAWQGGARFVDDDLVIAAMRDHK